MRPLIGIPPRLSERGPEGAAWRIGGAVVAAVEQAGGAPLLLPAQRDVEALLTRIDGLLVPGGGDFLPPRAYPAGVEFDPVAPRQLEFDTALLAAARATGLPLLGICYGMQLLALHCGGSLHYDLPTDLPGAASHRLGAGRHEIALAPGSALARILDGALRSVNSRHHQAVADPGRARVGATAPDGVVEAIELDGAFAIGVQWHPEDLEGPGRERLFGAFVAACAARRGLASRPPRPARRAARRDPGARG
jgi:putative glutamine amidotransferase